MKKKPVLSRLLKYTYVCRKYIIIGILSAVISIAATLAGPRLVAIAIDQMIGMGAVNFSGIAKIIFYLAGTIAISSLFQWLLSESTNIIAYRTVKQLRIEIFAKFNRAPLKFIDSTPHGDMVNRTVNDIDQISDGLLQGFTQLFTGIATIVGTLIFMLSVDVVTALVVIILTPLSIFTAFVIARLTHKMFRQQAVTQSELTSFVNEMVSNQKIVKAFSHENENIKEFDKINKQLYQCGVNAQFYSSLSNPSTRFVNSMVYAAVGVVGAIRVIGGSLTVGGISCFLSYANQYTKPFNEISGVLTQLQSAFASAQRVFEVLDTENEPADKENALSMPSARGNISLENVSFSYDHSRPLLQNISANIKKGQKIAIVGPTGCGKTTLINLLLRFYDIDGGKISVDGIDIKDIKRDDLRALYAMVLQETWLQTGTIRENIIYGRPDATEDEIIEAAKAAYVHGFVSRMKKGYDTVISGEGSSLSQGQKQLLCIARAMLVGSPILILDEATSNIDSRTEIKVQRAFEKLTEGKTSFIVAHRLSTIKEANLILVMKDGNIIEQGTHNDLLCKDTFYKKLYESQFSKA
ncbi:MAG: ABC transporter ATP-binding protein [Bacillota bacterium]|nr:ABC transporter ATP-binding protein [Bacillota bacterium]